MRILGIIPSRYASTRLPAKPLVDIGGKTMIRRVYEQASKASLLAHVVVATDHIEIEREITSIGGSALLTSPDHPSGTDRCAALVATMSESFDYVINIQGDEPFIHPEEIDTLARLLMAEQPDIGTLIKKIEDPRVLWDPSKVKVVVSTQGQGLFFSRQAIPFLRDVPKEDWLKHHTFYRHLGMYGYRTDLLPKLAELPASSLEQAESLEQLRWLENGYQIKVAESPHDSFSIDTPEDLVRARQQTDLF